MPWWSWILIWVGLVLILLGVLALLAWWLLRKLLALQADLGQLQAMLAELERRAEQLVDRPEPARPAIVQGRDAVAAERRTLRRRLDRQAEARREAQLQRGRLLTKADPMKYAFLARRK